MKWIGVGRDREALITRPEESNLERAMDLSNNPVTYAKPKPFIPHSKIQDLNLNLNVNPEPEQSEMKFQQQQN